MTGQLDFSGRGICRVRARKEVSGVSGNGEATSILRVWLWDDCGDSGARIALSGNDPKGALPLRLEGLWVVNFMRG